MHLTDKHGVTYQVRQRRDTMGETEYLVMHGKRIIAVAELPHEYARYVSNVFVDGEFRRRGIASALYDLIEHLHGIELRPSHLLLTDGELFWLARDPDVLSSSRYSVISEPPRADVLARP